MLFDPESKKIQRIETDSPQADADSLLRATNIYDIGADPEDPDQLWLATDHGILMLNVDKKQVQQFLFPAETDTEQLYANIPQSIYITSEAVYYGTWYSGLFKLDRQTSKIERNRIFADYRSRFIKSFHPR